MKSIIKKQFIDCSDTDSFCFSLECPECVKVWKSTPVRFSKAGENSLRKGARDSFGKSGRGGGNFFQFMPALRKNGLRRLFHDLRRS